MKSLLLLISMTVLTLTSCIQENLHPDFTPDWPTPDPKPKVPKVKTEKGETDEGTYFYDEKGRQIKYVVSSGYHSETTYSTDQILKMNFNSDGALASIVTFDVNAKGLRTKYVRSDVPALTYYYEYNTADQVSKTKAVSPGTIFENFYYYTHDNLDSVRYVRNGVYQYTYKYFYYNDIPNKMGNEIYGLMYEGKDSKNLLKNWYGTGTDGNVFVTSAYSYTFDDKDRVTSQVQAADSYTQTFDYTYY
jgi:hypothetical protein